MAFVYEVNGQRVEFEKEPTEADIDEAARSLRPAPQSRQPKPVEGAGGAAFGIYRPQGRRPENQQDREAAKDMAFQTARGVVTGALGGPSDLANLPGVLYSAATGQPQPYQIPYGSEQFNEMLPGKSDAPSAKLARFGGEVMAPFPSVKAVRAIPGAVRGAGDVVSGAVGTGTGYIARPGRAPQGYQIPSQRNPIGSSFTPPEELAKFERGELPYGQMPEQRPISELPEGRLDKAAMMLSGGNIPNAGQGAKAFGERLGETYRNPLTAAADIGSMFFTGGVPVLTTLRGGLAGAQALADMRLAKKGFTPELPKILDEYQTGVRPMPGIQPGPMPRGFQAAGPVSPGGIAQPTSAAQAAMATTQRVARTTAAPRPQAQPFVLPDAGTHYTQAEQVGDNFGDIFNKAVTARATDLLRDARQTGKSLTSQQANDLAFDEIKEFRRNNVDAFKPKQEPTGPVAPTATPEEAIAQFNPPKPDYELVSDQGIWKRLQDKTASGTPLEVNEQTAVRRITNKYGQDPFQTGNLTGESVFETPKRKNVKQETRVKEMEAERTKDMTPEQIAADEQAILDRVKRMANPNSPFNKTLKGSGGRGTMGMMTGKTSSGNVIDDAPWLSNKEFESESVMRNLGLGTDENYVLKTKYPEANVIKTADSSANARAIEYNDGSSFMVRNNKGTDYSQYSIFNNDGTNYEISRKGNKILSVSITKNGEYVGGLEDHAFSNGKQWKVHQKIEGGPPGGGQILGDADVKEIGTAETRKLLKKLKAFDFNKIVDEQLAREEAIKQGK